MSEKVGEIYYDVERETAQLLTGANEVKSALSDMTGSAKNTGKAVDNLGKEAKSTASNLDQITSHAKSMDGSLQSLNTTFSAVATAISQANTNSLAASMTLTQMNAAMQTLISSVNSMASAMKESSSSTAAASNEYSRAESIIEGLGNQIAILEEANENGARSAAVLAAQLRAGSAATDDEKQKIGQLTGQLFDMKNSTDQGAKSHGNWRAQMQQAGYQVQDFIVQVQGGQSALVAFSQQGSQLAGAFGPSGAIIGAIIALGSVLAGTLVKSMGSVEDQMKTLATATNALNDVINISQSGVAALSDKYALLARTNAEAATILRNQAIIEYNQAVSKLPSAINDAATSIFGLGDSAKAAFAGATVGISAFNDILKANQIETDNVKEAFSQLASRGDAAQGSMLTFSSTISALSSNFGISEQQAFNLAKQLQNVSQTKSPEALQALVLELQGIKSSSTDGQVALTAFISKLVNLVSASANAKANIAALKGEMDNLTQGQKNLIQQSERDLELSKKQGAARARLQALYKARDAGFSDDSKEAIRMQNEAEQTYNNVQAQQKLKTSSSQLAKQEESVAQKLANLKQQSELAATSTTELSREQAILTAQQSLGKGATQEQIALAGQYAAKKWDTANALKAQAAAEKLIPEARENASYAQDVKDLQTAYNAKKITQQQYNQTSEQLEQQHQVNLAKIRAEQNSGVSPLQDAQGAVDPVQQLANENARKLALIQQFETEKGVLTQNGLALMNAANTEYEQARLAAQWEIYKAQSDSNALLGTAIESLGGGATNAITGLLNGTQSLSEAFANLGTSVLNGLVSSLVEMGVRWVESAVMGQAAQTTAIASNQATAATALTASVFAGSAAAAELLAAWSPAAMAASVATSGGAAAAGVTGFTTAMTTAQALSVAGMRKNGGPVSANSMYQVGEGGKPEIFKASNGSQYMIPGDNGSVISNKDIGSSGSGSTIQQVNHFTIQSATGDPQDLANQIATISYQQSLRAMKDQQRPGGILRK
ncbi:tail protein (tape measure) [Pantoea sp.]|uniref:tail protein (tape measure) n=1 Tax=Pantoea sp. TaxID=69393 RepID=UPI0028AA7156|nr:tail protein (tape measure) [Pantoea sp.]